jgi:hypothetical protein
MNSSGGLVSLGLVGKLGTMFISFNNNKLSRPRYSNKYEI